MFIKFVKLLNGDELICEYEELDNGDIQITNPVRLGFDPEAKGFKFIPYPMFVGLPKTILVIKSNHILFTMEVNDECDTAYKRVFGYIVEAKNKLVI